MIGLNRELNADFSVHPLDTWQDLVANQQAKQMALGILHHQGVPPRMFLAGPSGSGKSTVINHVCRLAACHAPMDGEPCGCCTGCKRFTVGHRDTGMFVYLEDGLVPSASQCPSLPNVASRLCDPIDGDERANCQPHEHVKGLYPGVAQANGVNSGHQCPACPGRCMVPCSHECPAIEDALERIRSEGLALSDIEPWRIDKIHHRMKIREAIARDPLCSSYQRKLVLTDCDAAKKWSHQTFCDFLDLVETFEREGRQCLVRLPQEPDFSKARHKHSQSGIPCRFWKSSATGPPLSGVRQGPI